MSMVKSVQRVFEILELFQREKTAMSIVDISRELKYPHSSTLSILRTMQSLGYLSNVNRFDYFPSPKFLKLAEWLSEAIEDEKEILEFMNDLHEYTGETINLSQRIGNYVKILFGYLGTHPITINVSEGTLMPINMSFVGLTALACVSDDEKDKILDYVYKNYDTSKVSLDEATNIIEKIKHNKVSSGCDLFLNGIGAITIPVRSVKRGNLYIIGIVGPTNRLKENEENYLLMVKELLEKHEVSLA